MPLRFFPLLSFSFFFRKLFFVAEKALNSDKIPYLNLRKQSEREEREREDAFECAVGGELHEVEGSDDARQLYRRASCKPDNNNNTQLRWWLWSAMERKRFREETLSLFFFFFFDDGDRFASSPSASLFIFVHWRRKTEARARARRVFFSKASSCSSSRNHTHDEV